MAKLNARTGVSSSSRAANYSNSVRASARDLRAANDSFRHTPANQNLRSPWFTRFNRVAGSEAKAASRILRAPALRRLGFVGDFINLYDLWSQYAQQGPGVSVVKNPLWTFGATCAGVQPQYMIFSVAVAPVVPHCLLNIYPGPTTTDFTLDPGPTHRSAVFYQYTTCVPGGAGVPWSSCPDISRRYNRAETWLFPANAGRWYRHVMNPTPRRVLNYRVDPMLLPINQPVPLLRPLPRFAQKTVERLHNRLYGKPRVAVRRQIARNPLVDEGLFPYPLARVQIAPKPVVLPGVHRNRPPPRGTKERKFILAPAQDSVIGILANAVTETNDFVEALYFAIPPRLRGPKRHTTLQEKMAAIYLHYDQINVGYAFNNLLQNQIGDAIGGMQGRLQARANRKLGLSTGPRQFSPFK